MPDLTGLSERDAVRTLARRGLAAQLSGSGFVVAQDPPAGGTTPSDRVCDVALAARSRGRRKRREALRAGLRPAAPPRRPSG